MSRLPFPRGASQYFSPVLYLSCVVLLDDTVLARQYRETTASGFYFNGLRSRRRWWRTSELPAFSTRCESLSRARWWTFQEYFPAIRLHPVSESSSKSADEGGPRAEARDCPSAGHRGAASTATPPAGDPVAEVASGAPRSARKPHSAHAASSSRAEKRHVGSPSRVKSFWPSGGLPELATEAYGLAALTDSIASRSRAAPGGWLACGSWETPGGWSISRNWKTWRTCRACGDHGVSAAC